MHSVSVIPRQPRAWLPPFVCSTVTSLNLPFNAREVVDKGAGSVLDEIEGTILEIATTILDGNGFAFDVPSRAKGNQV